MELEIVVKINLDEIKQTVRRDFKDAKEFYLEEEHLQRLDGMGRFKRWFFTIIWLFKSLYLKLTPVRRILLVVSLFLILINVSGTIGETNVRFDSNLKIIGGIILLFILMLELKDKLLARDELIAGRAVQEALLPETKPDIPGWDVWLYSRPANDVGGDLIDIINLGSRSFGLALGDISGKGLPAALLMAKLQSTLRALVSEFDSIAALGKKINEIFFRDTVSKSFASLIYLQIKSGSESVKMLNAGHIPPVIKSKNGIQVTEKGDRALGISPRSGYSVKKILLKKNELLAIYSDGVIEAQNEAGEFFGTERLFHLLSRPEFENTGKLGESIVQAVEDFVGDSPRFDDLSLVLIRKK
jgi:sigma-B regulation protein RsbU (phosphoserine phosphatase)